MFGHTKRVLPADVYDDLRASVVRHGGIGAGAFTDCSDVIEGGRPLCIYGHAMALGWNSAARDALAVVDISPSVNDRIVRDLRADDAGPWGRITWEQWCAALRVVRGPTRVAKTAWKGAATVEPVLAGDGEIVHTSLSQWAASLQSKPHAEVMVESLAQWAATWPRPYRAPQPKPIPEGPVGDDEIDASEFEDVADAELVEV